MMNFSIEIWAWTAVLSSCLFFKRQTRYAQTSDILKNKQLDSTAVEIKKKVPF